MKFLNKSIYALSLVSMMGLWSCSQEEMLQGDISSGEGVPLRITLNRGGDLTRTIVSENDENGSLNSVWKAGDKIFLYDTTGKKVSEMTLKETLEGDASKGVFEGTMTGESGNYILWYYPSNSASTTKNYMLYHSVAKAVKFLFPETPFTTDGELAKFDVLKKMDVKIVVTSEKAAVESDVTMDPVFAMVRFSLKNLPETTGTLKITNAASDKKIITGYALSLKTGELNVTTSDEVDRNSDYSDVYELKDVDSSKDIYLPFVPGDYQFGFEFVTGDNEVYKYQFENTTSLEAGKYYNTFTEGTDGSSNTIEGVQIPLIKEEDDEVDDSDNPGNLNNWGGDHGSYGGTPSFVNAGSNDADAWTSNTRSLQAFGYKKTASKRFNAIKNGHVVSWVYADGAEAKYFQYGRLLGFPKDVVYAQSTMLAYYANSSKARYPFGMNAYTDVQLYYCWDMDSRPTYAYSNAWTNGMNLQQAINSSIIYLVGDGLDYLKSANRSKSWAERSGNPCPDGYRVPTKDELSLFVPSKESFSNSLVESKTIDDVMYVIRWRKLSSTTVGVTTVKSNAKVTSATDPIFENATELVLEACGIVYSDDENDAVYYPAFGNENIGYYWSSNIEKIDGKYYAWAMKVGIEGDTVTINMEEMEPVVACGILPIRDDAAKATGFQPWFPKGY